jgi:RNA polymerase sigma-70 factor, ECF subfamily
MASTMSQDRTAVAGRPPTSLAVRDISRPAANHQGVRAIPQAQVRFLDLLEAHRRLLYKVARIYGQSAADREDLAQETVAQLWRAFPRYDERLKFSTWMYRIALNVAISWQRRERTRARHLVPDGEEILQLAAAPDAAGEDADVTLLYECIARLDDLNRALLMLYLDGQSHQEIGSVLGITSTNVATRIGRLKDRLRESFRAAGRL